jgi:hypothetical protein
MAGIRRTGSGAALGLVLLTLPGCAGAPGALGAPVGVRSPEPAPTRTNARYEAAAREHLAEAGLDVGRIVVIESGAWQRAAEGAETMADAMTRALASAAIPGLRIEARGESFCARSAVSADCMFVSAISSRGDRADPSGIRPYRVEAAVYVEPAFPSDAPPRMLWREELRTARLLLFLQGGSPPGQGVPASRASSAAVAASNRSVSTGMSAPS